MFRFAQHWADTWCSNPAFWLEVADTPNGLKLLEINAINSSGFYACDMGKFVNAINALV
ncbi:ATP-grasp domain-containing protein [Aquabacterium sp. A7-Y]|uniref:ATP-grasp domain-containing protein n=1 Tax=Aquabacterium sp. A7-Y TaxID=1349605 RepID=UPI00223E8695|nr:ATP-grasp domain-containing protein [Aquabacterium sp. A7-Y]MCW7540445.1 ATP-grasp domain-containing protein [Aquabacterium sp. A7-Y]